MVPHLGQSCLRIARCGYLSFTLFAVTRKYQLIERFSIDCRNTNAKVLTPSNPKRSKVRCQPIRFLSN